MYQETYPLVVPRILFNGQCAEALEFYIKAFGAIVGDKILFGEANPEDFQYESETQSDFIYYAELMIGKHMIMMHDDSSGASDKEAGDRISMTALCVSFDLEEKARAAYQALSCGGRVISPVQSNSFCSFHVTLVDKFGVVWDLYFGDA